jgi:hypothetical protein
VRDQRRLQKVIATAVAQRVHKTSAGERTSVLLDTRPIVALLSGNDANHESRKFDVL